MMTIILVVLVVVVSNRNFSRFADEVFNEKIQEVAHNVRFEISMQQTIAYDEVYGIAGRYDVITAIKEGNREKIRAIASSAEANRKCTYFSILDAEGKIIFRTDFPEQSGASLLHVHSVNEALTKKKCGVYFESTKEVPLAIRAAAPIFDETGTIIGAVTGGFRLDTDDWVDHVLEDYKAHCTVFLGDKRMATTIRREGSNERAVGTTLNNPAIYDEVIVKKQSYVGEATVVNVPMRVVYSPIVNEGDREALGILFVGMSRDRETMAVRNNIISNFTIMIAGLLIFVLILVGIIRAIVLPIRKMTQAAIGLADGNLDVDTQVQSKDETSILAKAFQKLSESLKTKTEVALAIAQGDMTVWVPLRSEQDGLGMALIRMRYSLYDSIKGLTGLAKAINEEAESLTQVNESLVNNATRSADQLKEIAGAIRILHTQTEQNAESSKNAGNLTQSAMNGSNDGREKMGRMVQAMESITKSSSEIKNIIRVIDDIAFQTNLLALNAAVEAARAGQHGKGFAVVAEEVRNLASRSAKAARETANLIEESIRQVELGSGVARETSDSLNVITDQVEQINKIVSTISVESVQQAKQLGEMTNTVSQVSSTADSNMQSVSDVSSVITSVKETAKELEGIIDHFKAHGDGKVMLTGIKYEGYIPPHGTFTHRNVQ